MSRPILEVSGLSMRFGGLLAVNGVNLQVKEKQVVSMIGPNGAGKTTVFNCLTGFYQPTGGTILLTLAIAVLAAFGMVRAEVSGTSRQGTGWSFASLWRLTSSFKAARRRRPATTSNHCPSGEVMTVRFCSKPTREMDAASSGMTVPPLWRTLRREGRSRDNGIRCSS